MLSFFISMPFLSSRQLIRIKHTSWSSESTRSCSIRGPLAKASSRANFRIPGGMSQPDSTNQAIVLLEAYGYLASVRPLALPAAESIRAQLSTARPVQPPRLCRDSSVHPGPLAIPKKTGEDVTLGGSTFAF